MTERTVRSLAKELAGVFYEQERSPGFRAAFPTFRDYLRGNWHQPDGSIKPYQPGWLYFVTHARKMLATMLTQPDAKVSPVMKERIFDALIEEHDKATKPGAISMFQKSH